MLWKPKHMSIETERRLAILDERVSNMDKRLVIIETAVTGWGDRLEKRISDSLHPIQVSMDKMAKTLERIEGEQQRQDGGRSVSRWILGTIIAIAAAIAEWFAHINFSSK
jgi:hypothetical protein